MSVGNVQSISVINKMPNDILEVTACYLEHDNHYLFLKRSPNKPAGRQWGVPAGKVENKEDLLDSLIREIKEETGICISNQNILFIESLLVKRDDMSFIYHMYKLTLDKRPSILLNDEHTDYIWVTYKEALELDLVPGAAELFGFLRDSIKS